MNSSVVIKSKVQISAYRTFYNLHGVVAVSLLPFHTCFIVKWYLYIHDITKGNKSCMQHFFINIFRYATYNTHYNNIKLLKVIYNSVIGYTTA